MAIKSKKFDDLKGKEKKAAMTVIIDAYERGDEVRSSSFEAELEICDGTNVRRLHRYALQHMAIWRMECVGFDQNLLQRIADVIDKRATH